MAPRKTEWVGKIIVFWLYGLVWGKEVLASMAHLGKDPHPCGIAILEEVGCIIVKKQIISRGRSKPCVGC